ncbi:MULTISPECIES: YadA C-terminal domain-containing protein [Enterobacter cloacae complex]|uniref:YadA C-terminal domain-containing protein n=1 Tax=Enterobacter cloacae complex TaxID=354276 RepID=UPI0013D335B3|nr:MULTISPECIES: YadA-like family protein [Enterobacter cloacae complex]MBG0579364.1 YadA-like family protein [Enterobacter kobei]
MKKSIVTLAVFGVLLTASSYAATDTAFLNTSTNTNIVIGIKGQDESVKIYDLDDMASAKKLDDIANTKVDTSTFNLYQTSQVNKDTSQDMGIGAAQSTADTAIATANTNTTRIDATDSRVTALENQPKAKDGVNGKDGATGAKGDKGETGARGANGSNGANGRDGVNGKDGITTTTTKVDTATQAKVTANTTSIVEVRKQSDSVAKDLDAAKQFFSQQASNNTKRINNIQDQQNEDRKEYRSGIAGAASIAGLHYVDTDNAVAIGAADYKSEQGYALGYRHKFAENVATTVSYAGTSNGDSVVAASASLGW